MKKNYIKLFFISFFIFILFPLSVNADNGYVIENYDVNIKVNENNVLNITETIDVNFTLESHGIIRKIPLIVKFDRKDFDTKIKAKIDNLYINETYTTTTDDEMVSYKIGDLNKTLTGKKRYIIKYDYDYGDDNIDKYDELYHNIIGKDWDTEIQNVTFTITMPKDFDETLVNFTVGYYGSTYYEDVLYEINNNVITGTVNKQGIYALTSNEALTVRIELPEGYFKNERVNFDPTFIIILFLLSISILGIIVSTILFKKYSYKKKDLLVPEFIVPDNLSSAEIGYVYKGSVSKEHIVSLITYFANKGYLKIIEENGNKFSFERLVTSIDDNEPDYAKITFDGLFKDASEDGIVHKSDLTDKFYTTLTTALFKLKKSHSIYRKMHYINYVIYIIILVLSIYLRSILMPFTTYRLHYQYNTLYLIYNILFVLIVALEIIYFSLNKKRSDDETKLYNKVLGFKEYLETVEKDKIIELVDENPNYFFDILPYAYVLGITKKWSEKFESISMKAPNWYVGSMYNPTTGMFDTNTFTNSLNSTLAQTSSVMSSRPYESSGTSGGSSSFGGGGFSAGGGGGGGGSRW